jgi:hypothetical protein
MKKTLIFIIAIILVMSCAAVGVCAEESMTLEAAETIEQTGEVATDVAESASDTVTETVETITETVETITETPEETAEGTESATVANEDTESIEESATGGIIAGESSDGGVESSLPDEIVELDSAAISSIASAIESTASRAEQIIKVATDLDISVEAAEKYIDKFIAIGDALAGDSEGWDSFSQEIKENSRFWASVVVVGAAALLLVIMFLLFAFNISPKLKALKKDRDTDRAASDENAEEYKKAFNYMQSALEAYKKETNSQIEALTAMVDALSDVLTDSKLLEIREQLGKSEQNTETSIKINHNTALQVMQLLYIIIGRSKFPNASEAAKRLWYENAISEVNSMLPPDMLEKIKRESAQVTEVKEDD